MSTVPWKEASTLIITAPALVTQKIGNDLAQNLVISSRVLANENKNLVKSNQNLTKTDYRIMMVKRSNLSSFMASAYVFPGGHVELSDYSPKWWDLFAQLGVDRETLINQINSRVNGPRPPMVKDPVTLKENLSPLSETNEDFLIPDIALRITAIRETFEETGVPLLTGLSGSDTLPVDLSEWRQKIRNDGSAFLELCQRLKQLPDIWSLYEWWDWLTPISVGHKRFDTMFYICFLNKQPKVILDNTEVTKLKWCTPSEIISEHTQEGVFLAPPQVYELARLDNFKKFNDIQAFAAKREQYGVERWMPVISTYKDGAISLLPGDDSYPESPDIIGLKPVPDFPETLSEMRSKVVNLNRIELRGPVCKCVCNCQLTCGHLSPVVSPTATASMQSKL